MSDPSKWSAPANLNDCPKCGKCSVAWDKEEAEWVCYYKSCNWRYEPPGAKKDVRWFNPSCVLQTVPIEYQKAIDEAFKRGRAQAKPSTPALRPNQQVLVEAIVNKVHDDGVDLVMDYKFRNADQAIVGIPFSAIRLVDKE